jgi:hypothetical protein
MKSNEKHLKFKGTLQIISSVRELLATPNAVSHSKYELLFTVNNYGLERRESSSSRNENDDDDANYISVGLQKIITEREYLQKIIEKYYSAKRSPLISGATGVIFGFNCPKSAPAGARPRSGI